MGETPFSLANGLEAVIPVETSVLTGRYQFASKEPNDQLHANELDLPDKKRELAFISTVVYKQNISRYYNKYV